MKIFSINKFNSKKSFQQKGFVFLKEYIEEKIVKEVKEKGDQSEIGIKNITHKAVEEVLSRGEISPKVEKRHKKITQGIISVLENVKSENRLDTLDSENEFSEIDKILLKDLLDDPDSIERSMFNFFNNKPNLKGLTLTELNFLRQTFIRIQEEDAYNKSLEPVKEKITSKVGKWLGKMPCIGGVLGTGKKITKKFTPKSGSKWDSIRDELDDAIEIESQKQIKIRKKIESSGVDNAKLFKFFMEIKDNPQDFLNYTLVPQIDGISWKDKLNIESSVTNKDFLDYMRNMPISDILTAKEKHKIHVEDVTEIKDLKDKITDIHEDISPKLNNFIEDLEYEDVLSGLEPRPKVAVPTIDNLLKSVETRLEEDGVILVDAITSYAIAGGNLEEKDIQFLTPDVKLLLYKDAFSDSNFLKKHPDVADEIYAYLNAQKEKILPEEVLRGVPNTATPPVLTVDTDDINRRMRIPLRNNDLPKYQENLKERKSYLLSEQIQTLQHQPIGTEIGGIEILENGSVLDLNTPNKIKLFKKENISGTKILHFKEGNKYLQFIIQGDNYTVKFWEDPLFSGPEAEYLNLLDENHADYLAPQTGSLINFMGYVGDDSLFFDI